MELGMIGLGRMGRNMAFRLVHGGHRVAAHDRVPAVLAEAATRGVMSCATLDDLVAWMRPPRVAWLMVPAGEMTDGALEALRVRLEPGDVVVDGGNSHYRSSLAHHERFAAAGIRFLDVGVSGGVWGLELGTCMMVGGAPEAVATVKPLLDTLAPDGGWARVGGPGAGHFARLVHNGVADGLMQAYAEGFEVLRASRFDLDLEQLAALWMHGSVIRSRLLELAGYVFRDDPGLEGIAGGAADPDEGRGMLREAIDLEVPVPALDAALAARLRSRAQDSFQAKVIVALLRQLAGPGGTKEEA